MLNKYYKVNIQYLLQSNISKMSKKVIDRTNNLIVAAANHLNWVRPHFNGLLCMLTRHQKTIHFNATAKRCCTKQPQTTRLIHNRHSVKLPTNVQMQISGIEGEGKWTDREIPVHIGHHPNIKTTELKCTCKYKQKIYFMSNFPEKARQRKSHSHFALHYRQVTACVRAFLVHDAFGTWGCTTSAHDYFGT